MIKHRRKLIFFKGQDIGDMHILDLERKLKPGNKHPIWYAQCKCNVCGREKTALLGHLLSERGCYHNSCSYGHVFDDYVGTDIDDMHILSKYGKGRRHETFFLVRCNVCGKEREVSASNFIGAHVGTSHHACSFNTHDSLKEARFYGIFTGITNRTTKPSCDRYTAYGARGIDAEIWKNFIDFKNDMFDSYKALADEIGEENVSIERIDVDGPYCPENCKWISLKDQFDNIQKTVYFIAIDPNGKEYVGKNLSKFCKEHGILHMHFGKVLKGEYGFKSHKGWKGYRITKEEYLQRTLPYVPESEVSFLFDIIHDAYCLRKERKLVDENGFIRVPVCALNKYNGYISPEIIKHICSRENKWNLKIQFDNTKSYPVFLVKEI